MRMLKSCLVPALVMLAPACAQAQDATACDKFKWSVAREKAWFEGGPQTIESGGDASRIDTGYAVTLKPVAELRFVTPPMRAPKPDSYGAVLTGPTIDKPGLYEITLSAEGWIDAIQGGEIVKTVNFSGQTGCPGVRKSVRFMLASGPLTVQLSNVAASTISLAIATAQ
jgi:hypothetical protein